MQKGSSRYIYTITKFGKLVTQYHLKDDWLSLKSEYFAMLYYQNHVATIFLSNYIHTELRKRDFS